MCTINIYTQRSVHNESLPGGSDFQDKHILEKTDAMTRIEPYILLLLPNLYYSCADIKENLSTIQMLPWKLSRYSV